MAKTTRRGFIRAAGSIPVSGAYYMPAHLEVEVGVPVATALPGNERIRAGILPGGRYAILLYVGPYGELIKANAALQAWAEKRGIKWQTRTTKDGTAWGGRAESYLTDPRKEPDPQKQQTEIAYLVAENRAR